MKKFIVVIAKIFGLATVALVSVGIVRVELARRNRAPEKKFKR